MASAHIMGYWQCEGISQLQCEWTMAAWRFMGCGSSDYITYVQYHEYLNRLFVSGLSAKCPFSNSLFKGINISPLLLVSSLKKQTKILCKQSLAKKTCTALGWKMSTPRFFLVDIIFLCGLEFLKPPQKSNMPQKDGFKRKTTHYLCLMPILHGLNLSPKGTTIQILGLPLFRPSYVLQISLTSASLTS